LRQGRGWPKALEKDFWLHFWCQIFSVGYVHANASTVSLVLNVM